MEDFLFKDVSKFARKNRKALKPAEQWLNEFDGDCEDIWEVVKNELPIDWRKIVFIAWLASDEKIYECKFIDKGFNVHQWCPKKKDSRNPQNDFLHDVILQVGHSYTTPKHPSLYLICSALNEGKKAIAGKKTAVQEKVKEVLRGKKKSIIGKILKIIGAIVGFLAALFTCIYSLWWLWTTFWKK